MKFKKIKRPKIRIRRPRVRIRWRKRTSWWVIGVVAVFFVSLLAFQLVLMNYAKSILQNILNLQIEQVSQGLYTSSFEDIEISYTKKNLLIRNLHLSARNSNDSADQPSLHGPDVYDLFIPEVKINGINLRKAYLQNFVDIQSLELESPRFALNLDLDDPESKATSILKKDLYNLLPERIHEFRIGTVLIHDAAIKVHSLKNNKKSELEFSPVQLELQNFHLNADNANDPEKFFFTDTFFLEADSVKGTLADETYRLQLEALKVSSSDSSAFARNIRLIPLKDKAELLREEVLQKVYQVEFPLFYAYGLSFNDLYHHRDLITNEVTVISPTLKVINLKPLEPGQKESFRVDDLYPAIDKILNSLQVKQLYLRNGLVNIEEYKTGFREKMAANIQLAEIQNFVLDSAASDNDQKLLYSDKINLKLGQYSLRLSDDLHLLQADELNFSSDNAEISARGFRVFPDNTGRIKPPSTLSYRATAPQIKLFGVAMLEAYNNNNLHIDSLQVLEPSLSLTRFGKRERNKEFHEEDLYALVEDFLYTLQINKISLQKGLLKIRNQDESEDAFNTNIRKAGLWNFRLDSMSAYQMNKLFYADNFELEIENYEHLLPDNIHKVKAESIEISTLTDRIHLSDIQINADDFLYPYSNLPSSDSKSLLNIQVPSLMMEGVDILSAYLHKKLIVKTVEIPGPSLQLGSLIGNQAGRSNLIKSTALYDLIKDFLEEIQVQNLQLQEGQLDLALYAEEDPLILSGRGTNIVVENFRFDSLSSSNPKRLFFANNVMVEMDEFETLLPDGLHMVRAKNIFTSTKEQKVRAENVDVLTMKENYSDDELLLIHGRKGYLTLHLPQIRVSGLNYDQAYYQEKLLIDTLYATQPNVTYTYLGKSSVEKTRRKINLKQTDFYKAISPYFEVLSVEKLILEEGRFSAVKQESGLKQENTLLEGIFLQMEGYQVDSSAIKDSQRFLYAEDIKLSIQKYKQELLDQVHILTARNMNLSTAIKQVEAEDVLLKPKEHITLSPSVTPNRYFVALPAIQIKGIGFDKVYKDNQLVIEELNLESPDILVRHHSNSSKKVGGKTSVTLKNYDLSELIKGNLQSLEVKEASLQDGKGEYIQIEGNKRQRFQTDKFSAQIKNFKLDEKGNKANKLFYSDDVQLSFDGYERNLPDSLHQIKIEKVAFSTKQQKLTASGIQLSPRIIPDLFLRMEQQNTNQLFRLTIPEVELSGINTTQIRHDKFIMDEVLIQGPQVEIIQHADLPNPHIKGKENKMKWYDQLLKNFQLLKSDQILVQDAALALTTIKNKETNTIRIGNIKGIATNFILDSIAGKQQNRTLFSDRVQLRVKDYSTPFNNDLYELKIADILLDSKDKKIVADSIVILPLVDRATFSDKKGYETDQFSFWNNKTVVKNLDFESLFKDGSFLADSLILDGFNLHVFRDKRQPFPEEHYPKMPQEMIRNMETELMIKGVAVQNGYIRYEEQVKGAREPGFMELTEVKILSDTISNKPELLKNGLTTNFRLDCYLMGTGHLQAYFKVPLADTLNRHSYYGTLDEMYLPDFNPILENTVFIKIRNGYADKIYFEVVADKENAEGQMEFQYRDLKVALVNKRTGKTGGIVKEMGSLLANMFVVDTHNTDDDKKPVRQGEMIFARDENRSVVNYWVKTLVNGFKSSIGL